MNKEIFEHVLRTLNNNKDELLRVYSSGDGVDNYNDSNSLKKLDQIKAITLSNDQYFIQSDLRRFLDLSLNKEIISKIEPNVTGWLEYLRFYVDMYKSSLNHHDDASSAAHITCISEHVREFSRNLNKNIEKVAALVNSDFANVKTLEEKKIQNKFYVSIIDKLNKGVSLLSPEVLREHCQGEPYVLRIVEDYIIKNLSSWINDLHAIIIKLNRFLFSIREMERQNNVIRGFALYLDNHIDFEIKDDYISDASAIPEIFNRISPLSCKGFADIDNDSTEKKLIEIASKLPVIEKSDKENESNKRSSTILTLSNNDVHEVEVQEIERRLLELLSIVIGSDESISAMWFYKKFVGDSFDADTWLIYLYGYFTEQQEKHSSLKVGMKVNYYDKHKIVANDDFYDITFTRRTA